MSGAFEQTIIVGNVGRDPQMRYTPDGTAVCDFSVAVSSRWTDRRTNEKKERTNWYRVTAWRQLAEVCNQYVKKGMSVMVTGTCAASAYLGQDGQPRATLELTAQNVQFLNRAEDGAPMHYEDESAGGSDYRGAPPRDMDDIPF